MKKISIIIPVYQAEEFIIEAIESCVNQTYQNIEIIIIDDGCIDNSINLVTPYLSDKRVKLIKHQENLGTFAARKTGVLSCSGDNILFLDSDDKLELNACEELNKYSDKDIVIFQFYSQKNNIVFPVKLEYGKNDDIITFFIKNKYYMNYSSAGKFYKKSVLEKAYSLLSFVNDKFFLAEDAVLFLAAIQNISTIFYLENILYFYRYNVKSVMIEGGGKNKLQQYQLALNYIKEIQSLQKDEGLKEINRYFDLYIERDMLYAKFKNKEYRYFFWLIILYLNTYGIKRFAKLLFRKFLKVFK